MSVIHLMKKSLQMDNFNWITFLQDRIIELEKIGQAWRIKYKGEDSNFIKIKFILLEDAIELNTRLLASICSGGGISNEQNVISSHL